jgi:hypothetical protein
MSSGSAGPRGRRECWHFLWVLSIWIPFFWQKTVFWNPLLRCGSNCGIIYRGSRLLNRWRERRRVIYATVVFAITLANLFNFETEKKIIFWCSGIWHRAVWQGAHQRFGRHRHYRENPGSPYPAVTKFATDKYVLRNIIPGVSTFTFQIMYQ